MKKLSLLFVLTVIFSSLVQAQGKDAIGPQFVVKTNLLPIVWGPIPFTGEYRLVGEAATGSRQSAQLALSYLGSSALLNVGSLEDTAGNKLGAVITGYRFQATYKFFLSQTESPEGFYMGPHISYASARLYDKTNSANFIQADYFNLVGMLGYQMISDGGFAFDFFMGAGYKNNAWSFGGNVNTDKFSSPNNIKIYFGFNFGMAF